MANLNAQNTNDFLQKKYIEFKYKKCEEVKIFDIYYSVFFSFSENQLSVYGIYHKDSDFTEMFFYTKELFEMLEKELLEYKEDE